MPGHGAAAVREDAKAGKRADHRRRLRLPSRPAPAVRARGTRWEPSRLGLTVAHSSSGTTRKGGKAATRTGRRSSATMVPAHSRRRVAAEPHFSPQLTANATTSRTVALSVASPKNSIDIIAQPPGRPARGKISDSLIDAPPLLYPLPIRSATWGEDEQSTLSHAQFFRQRGSRALIECQQADAAIAPASCASRQRGIAPASCASRPPDPCSSSPRARGERIRGEGTPPNLRRFSPHAAGIGHLLCCLASCMRRPALKTARPLCPWARERQSPCSGGGRRARGGR